MPINTTESFVSRDQARAHLGLDSANVEQDALLDAIVDRVAGLMNAWTGRKLKKRTHANVLLDGTGLSTMSLPEWPVDLTAAFVLYASADRVWNDSTLLERWDGISSLGSQDFVVDSGEGVLARIDGDVWPRGTWTVKVDYTAGVDESTIEAELFVEAALLQVADWWHRIGEDPQVSSFSMPGVTKAFVAGTGPFSGKFRALSPQVRTILDSERRIEFA